MEKKYWAFIVVFVWLLGLTLASFTGITGSAVKGESSWQCVQFACDEIFSFKEMQQQYCDFNGQDVVCNITLNGQAYQIPVNQINWSGVQPQCKKVRCVQEIPFRDVNYSLGERNASS